MSRCIQECDLFSIDLNNISTDVLCDTACLVGSNICFADGIQKRCFTVVYVSHYTDNRWTFYKICLIFFVLFQKFSHHINFLFFFSNNIKFESNFFCLFKRNILIQGYDLPLQKQFLYKSCRRHLHLICQFTNCQTFRNRNLLNCLFRLFNNRFRLYKRTFTVWILFAPNTAHFFFC